MLPIVGDAIGKGGKIARAAIKHGDEVLEVAGKQVDEVLETLPLRRLDVEASSMQKVGDKTSGLYSNLKDSKSVGEGKKFTPTQKKKIIQQNMERNGGVIKSDLSGEILVPATQSKKGVTPNPLEAQIDHIDPSSKGGSNSYSNAQVLSREENIKKSNKRGDIDGIQISR